MVRSHFVTLVAALGTLAVFLAAQVHLFLAILVGALALAPLPLSAAAFALRAPLALFCLAFAQLYLFTMLTGLWTVRYAQLLVLGVVIWWAARTYFGEWTIRRLPSRYAIWAALLVAWACFCSLSSLDVAHGFLKAANYSYVLLGLWVFNHLLDDEKAIVRFFKWLILGVALYSGIVFAMMLERAASEGFSLESALAVQYVFKQRLHGQNPNAIPTPALFCAPFVLVRFLDRPRERLLDGALFLLFAAVIVLSMSRATWLGVAIGCVVGYVLLALHQRRWRELVWAAAAGLLTSFTVMIAFWGTLQRLVFVQRGTAGRIYVWESALRMIRDHPITGIGPGSWQAMNASYAVFSGPLDITHEGGHAHNAYLMIAAEMGLPGLLLTLVFLGMILNDGLRAVLGRRDLNPAFRLNLVGCVAVTCALAARGFVESTMLVWPGHPADAIWLVLVAVSVCRASDRGARVEGGRS